MNKYLLKINLSISLILLGGFAIAAWLGGTATYRASIENLELVTSLTADGIYYQLSQMLNKPVNIAQTMAQDTFLVRQLEQERANPDNSEFVANLVNYLATYHKEYSFNSIFLASVATERYYTYNGIDYILSKNNPEHIWYHKFLKSDKSYEINIYNDTTHGTHNNITLFINCKIKDSSGNTIGVVGLGIKTGYIKSIIDRYENKYNVEVFFINNTGKIEVSSSNDGNQDKNLFHLFDIDKLTRQNIEKNTSDKNFGVWVNDEKTNMGEWYFITRYMPTLSWHVVIGHNTTKLINDIKSRLFNTLVILTSIMIAIIFIIAMLIKRFNKNIADIIEQRHNLFKKATEVLYDNIFEWNIDKNKAVGRNTENYIKSLGAINPTYDESISLIAEKQILAEFRKGYLETFSRKNILKKFNEGNEHLQYDFKSTNDGINYHWLRIDGHIFYSPDDNILHMFTYRKNIDAEKEKELLANIDEMTGCYTKKATERMIDEALANNQDSISAFFILDIDNFKHANDKFGHAFGDICIKRFAAIIQSHFRQEDIVGRLGGDEFGVFIPGTDMSQIIERTRKLSKALNFTCSEENMSMAISASIGVAVSPKNGATFSELYHKADEALYRTKQGGKNGYNFA